MLIHAERSLSRITIHNVIDKVTHISNYESYICVFIQMCNISQICNTFKKRNSHYFATLEGLDHNKYTVLRKYDGT